jgi:hypothetical protein
MRIWLLPLLAGIAHAASIRGTVVENLSGRPVSRANVLLEPVAGSGGTRATVHTDTAGVFVFQVPPGVYILQATRTPFLPSFYGQKRWNSAGMPLTVTENETAYANIRMMRYAAIAGRLVDENDVGQPEFRVAAYRNTRPLQLVADATADERGVFRIYGLLPGNYLVRSLGQSLAGIGYVPTFAHETEEIEAGRTVDVQAEEEARAIDVRPIPGQLFSLIVTAEPLDPGDAPVTITFVSEMSRQVVQAQSHTFAGLTRGDYEVFAEAPSRAGGVKQSAYQRLSLTKDSAVALPLTRIQPVYFQFEGLPMAAESDGTVRVLGRRKDLAGFHDPQVVKLQDHRANLTAGPWELALAPIDGYYVAGFAGPGPIPRNQRADGWNEVMINNGGSVRFSLSGNPGGVHGTVMDAGNPAVGAPVFLEAMDLEPARRVTDTYVTITDVQGKYGFTGLAPGRYRVLSSFEYQMPDSNTMALAGAKEVHVDVRTDLPLDLDLYVIR